MKHVHVTIDGNDATIALRALQSAFGKSHTRSRPDHPIGLEWDGCGTDMWYEPHDGGGLWHIRTKAMELWFMLNMPEHWVQALLEAPDVPDQD